MKRGEDGKHLFIIFVSMKLLVGIAQAASSPKRPQCGMKRGEDGKHLFIIFVSIKLLVVIRSSRGGSYFAPEAAK